MGSDLIPSTSTLSPASDTLRLFIESVVDYGIFVLDPEGHVASWNKGAQALAGYKAEEIVGKHVSVFYPSEDVKAGRCEHDLSIALASGHFGEEGWQVRKDGTRFWASVVITALRDEAGALRGFGNVTRDLTARMLAESDLRRHDERHRLLVEQVKDYSIFMLDPSGRVETWNEGAERMKLYRADEIVGKHFSVFYPKEDVYSGKCEYELKVASEVGRFEDEGWRLRKDGTRFWASVVITAIRDPSGELRGFGKVTRDLTERKLAEEQLRRSEERHRLLIEQVQDYAIFMLAPDGTVVSWNTGAKRLKGYDAEEIIGKHFSTFYPREDVAAGKCEHELRVASEVGRYEDEGWRVRKDGTRFFANVILTAIRDASGALRGFGKVTRDLTERRRAEEIERQSEVVRRSETALAEFFENAPVGVRWIRPDGIIMRANRAELALLGYSADEYVGQHVSRFHADPETLDALLSSLSLATGLVDFEARVRCKDGSIKHVSLSSNALMDQGKLVHSRCFTRDITGRMEAEAALKDADRRKDEFLAMLSHELRNPLAPITNSLELLRRRIGDRDDVAGPLGVLARQAQYLKRLVDDLLEASRISRGKIRIAKEPIDASVAVARAVELSRSLIESKKQHLAVSLPDRPLWLEADLTRLVQALSNLLNNASKYSDEGGHVWLTLEGEGAEVVYRVRDDGVGIDESIMPRLFELFTQADTSLDRSQGGLGIGLALVRGLVELHGGTVQARSDGPGKGSELVVRLPALGTRPALADLREAPPPQPDRGPRRVVVVDDNVDAAETLAEVLRLGEHQVVIAHDGFTALDLVRSHAPDIVMLDIGLPRMDGYEVARRLRQEHGPSRFLLVALTGYGREEDRLKTKAAGFDHHLVKPLDLDELAAVLARVAP